MYSNVSHINPFSHFYVIHWTIPLCRMKNIERIKLANNVRCIIWRANREQARNATRIISNVRKDNTNVSINHFRVIPYTWYWCDLCKTSHKLDYTHKHKSFYSKRTATAKLYAPRHTRNLQYKGVALVFIYM